MSISHEINAHENAETSHWHFAQRYGLLIGGCLFIAFMVIYRMNDDPRYSICFMRRVLGVPCPTCGMTRALNDFAHFDWRAAIAHHPLSPLVLICVLGGWLWMVWHHIRSKRAPLPKGKKFTLLTISIALLFIITWIFRVLIPLLRS